MDQNSVAEHYEIDFDMIFRLNAAQNLVVKHYIIEFYMIFHFINAELKSRTKNVCRTM